MANSVQKSSFAQTCNLLSHFMKERGGSSFGDVSLGLNAKLEAKGIETLNLLPSMENNYSAADQKSKQHLLPNSHLYPQLVAFPPPNLMEEDTTNKPDLRKSCASDPAAGAGAQMTVFYGGKVIVFDDLPAEKAKTIMGLAIQASSTNTKDASPLLLMDQKNPVCTNSAQNHQLPLPPPNRSDVQIATRKSLHRFFAKRKERAAAKAPYQANNPSSSSSWASASTSVPLC